ncbi:MAG: hypothetical protein L6Q26_03550 [Anaerolineales bacterium]|nr:hypothetical protein [Anaerolineales bacterium]NUQ84315.1 hypothetical protein [Anaerolineales bacterium]
MKRLSLLLVALSLFIPSAIVLAQGGFDYLTVKGPGITGEINITNPALTQDFFAFADFTRGEIPPPADPGQGYEIVRVYVETVDDKPTARPFDQLHYYPYTGYVFYDGLVEGSSEYDGKWYAANPSANEPFRAALAERARLNWIPLAILVVILAAFFIAYNRKPKPNTDH